MAPPDAKDRETTRNTADLRNDWQGMKSYLNLAVFGENGNLPHEKSGASGKNGRAA
jgi:hypothetical protein